MLLHFVRSASERGSELLRDALAAAGADPTPSAVDALDLDRPAVDGPACVDPAAPPMRDPPARRRGSGPGRGWPSMTIAATLLLGAAIVALTRPAPAPGHSRSRGGPGDRDRRLVPGHRRGARHERGRVAALVYRLVGWVAPVLLALLVGRLVVVAVRELVRARRQVGRTLEVLRVLAEIDRCPAGGPPTLWLLTATALA